MTAEGFEKTQSKSKSNAHDTQNNHKKLETRRRIEEMNEEKKLRQELNDLI